jgi:hypothetical protein
VLGRSAILVDVVYARSIAVARGDRELFLRHLDAALAVDLSRFPDRRLSNELARLKAERYRAAVDSLIPATETIGRQVSGTAGAGTGNRSPAR